ncbi:MAG: hypothetical protein KGL31_03870 [candidate division NC10 bacterium]|nr:hypothetical protein [candidate division NC10 bacterium]MDE2321040.1 hypothetical protein [candidate division NC10 bacterium]
MRKSFGLVLVLASVPALGACTSIPYKPALSLGPSPVRIPAKMKVETFVDRSPSEDKTKRAGGSSATEPDSLVGDLGTEVTNAVIADFLANGVFAEVGKNIERPDAVMTGEIKRFYGRAGLNSAGWITLPINPIWLLGVPMQSTEGGVDLEVSIRRLDGTLLGTYSGRSQFSDWYTMYNQSILGVGTALNRSFTQAIQRIRDQIIADKGKF